MLNEVPLRVHQGDMFVLSRTELPPEATDSACPSCYWLCCWSSLSTWWDLGSPKIHVAGYVFHSVSREDPPHMWVALYSRAGDLGLNKKEKKRKKQDYKMSSDFLMSIQRVAALQPQPMSPGFILSTHWLNSLLSIPYVFCSPVPLASWVSRPLSLFRILSLLSLYLHRLSPESSSGSP